jgi:hypothetical protein
LFHWLKSALSVYIAPESDAGRITLFFNGNLVSGEVQGWMARQVMYEIHTLRSAVTGRLVWYDSVRCDHWPSPGLPTTQMKLMRRVCFEFGVAFPPIAGALERLFLESMEAISEQAPRGLGEAEQTLLDVEEFVKASYQVSRTRPFHLGLQQYIREGAEQVTDPSLAPLTKLNGIYRWARNAIREPEKSLAELSNYAATELAHWRSFIVLGLSETVAEALGKLFRNRRLQFTYLTLGLARLLSIVSPSAARIPRELPSAEKSKLHMLVSKNRRWAAMLP